MFEWLRRSAHCGAMVLYRGTMPPRLEEFADLRKRGVTIRAGEPHPDAHFTCHLDHPQWGEARLICPRKSMVPAPILIEWDAGLTRPEKELALAGRGCVLVTLKGRRENVLRDRKHLLHYMGALMGDDGVAAFDETAQRFWSRAALDNELAHDADVDIAATFNLHVVTREQPEANASKDDESSARPVWAHTHGLSAVGGFDFDILYPASELFQYAYDAFRAIAYAIVEGAVTPSTPKFKLAHPGGTVRFVDAATFRAQADPALLRETGLAEDDCHIEKRAVLCEPAGGLLSRWSKKVQPSRFLSAPIPDGLICRFSDAATELMAQRARGTYSFFRQIVEELRPFDFPTLVKLGYETDSGSPSEREHLWFQVHAADERRIDATLVNQPHDISRMSEGQRGAHEIDRLTDWTILTPAGPIDPRSTKVLRFVRDHRDELLAAMRA